MSGRGRGTPAPSPAGTSRSTLRRIALSSAVRGTLTVPVSLVLTPFILHAVTVEQYGVFATLSALVAVAGLSDFGLRTEIIRRVGDARGRGDDGGVSAAADEGAGLLLWLGGALLVGSALAAPWVTPWVFGDVPGLPSGQISVLLVVMVGLTVLTMVVGAYLAVLNGLQRSDVQNYATLAATVVSGLVAILAARRVAGAWALVAGSVIGVLLTLSVQLHWLRRVAPYVRFRPRRPTLPVARAFLAVGGFVLFAQLANVIDFQFDKVVISHVLGVRQAGEYQLGANLSLQARLLLLLPVGLLLPGLAELRISTPQSARRLFSAVSGATLTGGVALYGGILVLAGSFVPLWLGGGHEHAALAARGLAVALFLNLLTVPLYYYALSRRWGRLVGLSCLVNVVLNAALSWTLTVLVGFTGALVGSAVGNLAGSVVLLVGVSRRSDEHRWLAQVLPALLLGVVVSLGATALGAAGTGLSWAVLVAAAALMMVTTVLGALALRLVRLDSLRLLLRAAPTEPAAPATEIGAP